MSLEFNRRSFLKYTAVAAVAVAGSSLLTGCGDDEYQPTGKIGSTLKLMGTYKMEEAPVYNASTKEFTCTLNIKCTTSKVPLCVSNGCFELTVTRSKKETNYTAASIVVDPTEYDLKESEKAKDFDITVKGVSLQDGDTVEFKYWPRLMASSGTYGYTRAYCTWEMTATEDSTGAIVLE